MVTKFIGAFSAVGVLMCAAVTQGQSSQLPPPWKWSDVGVVGTAGSVVVGTNNDWHVSGAGSDIWGSADSFVYAYQPIRDGGIIAEIDGESTTSPFAKAGVMIRQTLDPGSPEIILDVKPDGGIEFMKRSAQAGETAFIAGGSVPVTDDASGGVTMSVTLQLNRSGTTVSAASCLGSTCTILGSTDFPSGPSLIGIAVTSHNPGALNTAYLRTPPSVTTVPFPWRTLDVGAVGTSGGATYDDATGTFHVSGAGSDIWGTADSFHAVARALSGDSVLTTRVVSEADTNAYAKAGVVMQSDAVDDNSPLWPGAARVILDVKPDGGIEFMARASSGASMSFIAGSTTVFPVWLRLTRTGDQFVGETSPDGQAWTMVGSVSVTLPSIFSGGLAVTSHDPSVLADAVFDNIGLTTGASLGPVGSNLLINDGFEDSVVPNMAPGWVSDAQRQTPAVTETALPHSGAKNAACRTTSGDCGLYQDVDGSQLQGGSSLVLSFYARADHPGVLVGVNVNGKLASSVRIAPGEYQRYDIGISAFSSSSPTIRVWLYAPAIPGVAAIDDVDLAQYFGPR